MRLKYQDRIFALALASGAVPTAVVLLLLWMGGYPPGLSALLLTGLLAWWLMLALAVRRGVTAPLRSLANLLESLRQGDYTVRGRSGAARDALAEVHAEANRLTDTLQQRKLEELEASSLLAKVLETIDIAVLIFNGDGVLQSINAFGADLYRASPARLAGRNARELGVADDLVPGRSRNAAGLFGRPEGRYRMRCRRFRSQGRPFDLLVISDLSRALRDEERDAWRKLIRVIGHEINNSLSPIKSVSESLLTQIDEQRFDPGAARQHLATIRRRAEGLKRFVSSYSRLAKLPPPSRRTTRLPALVRRVIELEQLPGVVVADDSPDLSLQVDADQVEQVLLNLLRNAREANQETGSDRIEVGWRVHQDRVVLEVGDHGPGLANPDNVFTPFFTTKPEGSGIGLLLSRAIVDAHNGALSLSNRTGSRTGCVARIELPWEPT